MNNTKFHLELFLRVITVSLDDEDRERAAEAGDRIEMKLKLFDRTFYDVLHG